MIKAEVGPTDIDPINLKRAGPGSLISNVKRILNAGSGPGSAQRIAPLFESRRWEEVRFDVDPGVHPDVVGSITDLESLFPPVSFDAVWCSHVVEHLYAHEVYPALRQFHRVLKPDGFALIMCPDLESVAQHLLTHGLASIAYMSAAGPIRPLDMIYGHSRAIKDGHHFMAHRTGFTTERLGNLLLEAGFPTINVSSRDFEICALALMEGADSDAVQAELSAVGFDLREDVV